MGRRPDGSHSGPGSHREHPDPRPGRIDAGGDAAGVSTESDTRCEATQEQVGWILTAGRSFDLWGGRTDVWVTAADRIDEAVDLVWSVIRAVDDACSPYRADSEITRLNDSPETTHQVSPDLLNAIEVAVLAAAATDGLTDPTVGVVTLPATGPLTDSIIGLRPAPPSPAARWQDIVIDREAGVVSVPDEVRLDLGATAKAWCADLAAQRVHRELGCGAMVNVGGDIATAGAGPAQGWEVLVADDHRWNGHEAHESTQPGARINLSTGALATSSTTVRRRRSGHHNTTDSVAHVVDPRTRRPVTGPYRTVSVAAATCAEANAAATAALVRGSGARRWLSDSRLPARLVAHDGTVAFTGGWPQ